ADEDLLALLDGQHAARGKAAAVTAAVDAVDDGLGEIAAPQEVRVQRVHHAPIVDGGARRLQRLTQHLPAENLRAAGVATLAAEQVDFESLELELLLKISETFIHQPELALNQICPQPNLKAPFMMAECPGKLQKNV